MKLTSKAQVRRLEKIGGLYCPNCDNITRYTERKGRYDIACSTCRAGILMPLALAFESGYIEFVK